MPINDYLIRDDDTLGAALRVIDRNALGLAFAVDADGRLNGSLDAGAIASCLAGGGSLAARVGSAMTAMRSTDIATVRGVVPVLDTDRRPVEIASPAHPRRIPVAEPVLTGNELKYVSECITTNWISSQGTFVRRFESEFAARLGVPHALAVSNGTVALHLALEAFDIGPGDEVIVPDLTFAATINAVLYAGATPVDRRRRSGDVEHGCRSDCRRHHAAHARPDAGPSLRAAGGHGRDDGAGEAA